MKITVFCLLLVAYGLVYGATPPITFPASPTPYTYTAAINDKVKSVGAALDRSLWTDPAITAQVKVTVSNDPNWFCGYSSRGGVTQSKTTTVYCPVPPGTKRQVTASMIVSGGTLQMSINPSFSTKE